MGDNEKELGGGLALLVAENGESVFRKSGIGIKGFYCFLLGAVLFLLPAAIRAAHSENF